MSDILNLVNYRITPNNKNFSWYIFTLILSNLFFHLLYLTIFLSTLFWKIKPLPKLVKVLFISLLTIIMVAFNLAQLLVYFGINLPTGNNANILTVVQAIEILHIIVFAGFFYCIFNIIFLKKSPFSLIYVGMYNIIHAIFEKCPIISLQNFLNPLAGNAQFKNTFWQDLFGDYTQLMRLVISLLSLAMFYLAFKQLQKANYKFRYLDCYFPWQDYKLNQAQK